ncbi:sel1 repeat family protein [Rhodobacteraceae bacterium RKSG542]|uniref:tetratricopeptide repeat protein n=1 Tax=Pseudovibrio flavus TaxID=2529854 RepID=UPI0012BCCDA8|nr:tetratricopeptide repeat protein [Pseudovibrio flavus]MTI16584.1 sel1 repeat family protein [Pseudovibrio flavus]
MRSSFSNLLSSTVLAIALGTLPLQAAGTSSTDTADKKELTGELKQRKAAEDMLKRLGNTTSQLLTPSILVPPPMQGVASAESGAPRSKAELAYGAFQRGWYLTALDLATSAIENGEIPAATLIGVLYETGSGVPLDTEKAAKWYETAASAGDSRASLRLGLMLLTGNGVKEDRHAAAEQFKLAAKDGIAEALINLALLYQEGEVLPRNMKKAADLLEQAADQGDVSAMHSLGQLLLDEAEETHDEMRGAFWLGRAARRGNVAAQVEYAILLFQGEGVVPNQKEAADWFEKAAYSGNPVAMNRLARIYAYGRGRGQNIVLAAVWQHLANKQGLFDSEIDDMTASLSLEQQEQVAEKVARLKSKL